MWALLGKSMKLKALPDMEKADILSRYFEDILRQISHTFVILTIVESRRGQVWLQCWFKQTGSHEYSSFGVHLADIQCQEHTCYHVTRNDRTAVLRVSRFIICPRDS